ncbi:MAG: SAF domain-containing protein [Arcanobacterium sp.]|nr:SAF domain-containing protein [Arcanobacterium sp.]MDY5589277.1 SAF domain-containing protein [Arcanobacterium sp.]
MSFWHRDFHQIRAQRADGVLSRPLETVREAQPQHTTNMSTHLTAQRPAPPLGPQERHRQASNNSVAHHRAIRSPSRMRALLWRWRWVLVALIIGSIAQSVLSAFGLRAQPMATIVVAAHDLSTGSTLQRSELTLASIPATAVPPGALTAPESALGRVLMAPLPAHAPIIAQQLLASHFATTAPPGMVITAVTLDDPTTVSVLQPGDRIQLYSPPPELNEKSEARLLTSAALVIAVKSDHSRTGILRDTSNKASIFVAIPQKDANLVIGFGAKVSLHAVLLSQ